MKTRTIFILAAIGLTLGIIQGCSDMQIAKTQEAALKVQGATTQPIVEAAAPLVPYGQTIVALVGAIAGAVVTFAPMFAKNKAKDVAIVELASDTKVSHSDAPFSTPTTAILGKLGVDTPGTGQTPPTV